MARKRRKSRSTRSSSTYTRARRTYGVRRRTPRHRTITSRTAARRIWKRIRLPLALAIILVISVPLLAKCWVHSAARATIFYEVSDVPKERVALVLGAGICKNGALSIILRYRVDKAIELYKAGKVDKLLMSGDNRRVGYNEPQAMMDYATAHGVLASDIREDFAGRRTYDSIYRARHIFGLKRLIVVTQPFHLDRSLFLCRKLGVKAFGVAAPMIDTSGATLREYPACVDALFDVYVLHPEPVMGHSERI